MTSPSVQRDERTVYVENVSYRRAYLFLQYGTLLIVAYRAAVLRQASWDLMSLVVASGIVAVMYQSRQGLPDARYNLWVTLVAAVLCIVLMAAAYWSGLLK